MKKILFLSIVLFLAVSHSYSVDFPKIKAFQPESEVMSYQPENLYEYINGAADAYLAYGFVHLLTRDFSYQDLKFSVDIYDMGSRLNAFGMYKTECPQDCNRLKIGVEAVVSPPYQCLLLKDFYYVKINVFEGEFTKETGEAVLKAIDSSLEGSAELPEELKLLPEKFKVKNSEGYNREAFIGLSILQRCVYAKYEIKENTIHYYVMVPTKKESSKMTWKKLTEKWTKTELNGKTVLFIKIPYKGFTGVVLTDGKILGVADCENKEQMLELLKTKL